MSILNLKEDEVHEVSEITLPLKEQPANERCKAALVDVFSRANQAGLVEDPDKKDLESIFKRKGKLSVRKLHELITQCKDLNQEIFTFVRRIETTVYSPNI